MWSSGCPHIDCVDDSVHVTVPITCDMLFLAPTKEPRFDKHVIVVTMIDKFGFATLLLECVLENPQDCQ
jgi:hypothetical protein